MLFRMESEIPPTIPLRLKIEINCFEHFNELGLVKVPFEMENSWFSGKCKITHGYLAVLLVSHLHAQDTGKQVGSVAGLGRCCRLHICWIFKC